MLRSLVLVVVVAMGVSSLECWEGTSPGDKSKKSGCEKCMTTEVKKGSDTGKGLRCATAAECDSTAAQDMASSLAAQAGIQSKFTCCDTELCNSGKEGVALSIALIIAATLTAVYLGQ